LTKKVRNLFLFFLLLDQKEAKLKAERCFCALGLYAGPPFCQALAWVVVMMGFTFLLDEVQRRKTTDRKRSNCQFAWHFLPYLYTKYVSFTSEYFSENTSLI
jgi:hypothetical protein